MTVNKYLQQVADLFDVDKRKCDNQKKCLKKALKKLKHRRNDLQAKLKASESSKASQKIEARLVVINKQRLKGLKLLKELCKT